MVMQQSSMDECDYVLVASKGRSRGEVKPEVRAFMEMLRERGMEITEIESGSKVFYCIAAPSELFEKYRYLLKVSDACNCCDDETRVYSGTATPTFTDTSTLASTHTGTHSRRMANKQTLRQALMQAINDCCLPRLPRIEERRIAPQCNDSGELTEVVPKSTRIRIVHFLLENSLQRNGDELGSRAVFKSMFCLHERKAQSKLKYKWAHWKYMFDPQPFNDIRMYFGEKVALYFLWLGWYTLLLLPAAVVGLAIFIYGLIYAGPSSTVIQEVCNSSSIMCPRCDKRCQVWSLKDTCTYTKVNQLFDNEGTVAFAMFMAIWATVFLELWKRHRAKYVSQWNIFDWSEEEEELIMEIASDVECKTKDYKYSYTRNALSVCLTTLLLVIIMGLTQALVMFRVVARVKLGEQDHWPIVKRNANLAAVAMGAGLHFLTMQIMKRVNRFVAFKLCDIERCRSYAATERSFTLKMFIFEFCTGFTSLVYIAFFLGRINGYPGNYTRIGGKWRLEECHPSGCLTDLFIQMSVILVLKQTIHNVVEFTFPRLQHCVKQTMARLLKCSCVHCRSCKGRPCDTCRRHNWIMKNYYLNDVHSFKLFDVYVDMVMQFSFTTIFVAAFPLAPLLALINNMFEIRGDANRMVCLERRLVPRKTNDIGIWMKVLEVIGVLAVIANGLVIGISSDFIPRLVYRYHYGPCANGTETDADCMTGYISSTLSIANRSEPSVQTDFGMQQMILPNGHNVTTCSYKDYRSSEDYSLTPQYWVILAIRFGFVILFEHVVVLCKFAIAWFIPDLPSGVRNRRLQDKMTRLKAELSEWKHRRQHTHTDGEEEDDEHTHRHTHTPVERGSSGTNTPVEVDMCSTHTHTPTPEKMSTHTYASEETRAYTHTPQDDTDSVRTPTTEDTNVHTHTSPLATTPTRTSPLASANVTPTGEEPDTHTPTAEQDSEHTHSDPEPDSDAEDSRPHTHTPEGSRPHTPKPKERAEDSESED